MSSNDPDTTRRQLLRDLSAGVLLASTNMSAAQAAAEVSVSPLPAPTTEYPRPPFAKQQQEWPGLASKMTPRPDHGELSYKGSGRLAGRKALITGGDSGMGRAAAIAFAREGADVAINYLPVEEPDAREGQSPDNLPMFGIDTPMGRPGQPAELAPLYVLLASAESSYSTGQVFGAVGGKGGP
jgi:hypothetical protein